MLFFWVPDLYVHLLSWHSDLDVLKASQASILNPVLSIVSLSVTGTNIHQVPQDRCLFTILDTSFFNHYNFPEI